MNYHQAIRKVSNYKHEYLLKYYDELQLSEQKELLDEIDSIDFEKILNTKYNNPSKEIYTIKPFLPVELEYQAQNFINLKEVGNEVLQSGKLGIVILAGGQGSRLGFAHSKGMYDIGITKSKFIFQIHMEKLLEIYHNIGVWLHCYIMTNSNNYDEIRSIFEANNCWGYNAKYLHFYPQGNSFCLDYNGNLFLSEKSRICKAPNGNGLFFLDLMNSKYSDSLDDYGIEWLNVVSVDNVLQNLADPVFMGAVLQSGATSGAKVVEKLNANENIGVICKRNHCMDIIEYFEIPQELKEKVDNDGVLLYRYGVILNYLFKVSELKRIDYNNLSIHIATKSMMCVSERYDTVVIEKKNALKMEYFITDLIKYMSSCVAFEVDRQLEFAPIKNLEGEDSVETARAALLRNGYSL